MSEMARKSDHQHEYYDVLIKHIMNNKGGILGSSDPNYTKGQRCKICGIVKDTYMRDMGKTEDGGLRMLTNKQMLEKYKDVEIVEVLKN